MPLYGFLYVPRSCNSYVYTVYTYVYFYILSCIGPYGFMGVCVSKNRGFTPFYVHLLKIMWMLVPYFQTKSHEFTRVPKMLFIVSKAKHQTLWANWIGAFLQTEICFRVQQRGYIYIYIIFMFVLCQRKIGICSCCSLMLVIYHLWCWSFKLCWFNCSCLLSWHVQCFPP